MGQIKVVFSLSFLPHPLPLPLPKISHFWCTYASVACL
jgi:hypothetical protein